MPPNAMVHNIVIGRTWVDAYGPLNITCPATGWRCRLDFKPCGWFGYGRYEFEGYVYDKGEAGREGAAGALWYHQALVVVALRARCACSILA